MNKLILAFTALSLSIIANAEQKYEYAVEGYTFIGTKTEIVDEAYDVIKKYRFFINDVLINNMDLDKDESVSKSELSEFFDKKLSQNN